MSDAAVLKEILRMEAWIQGAEPMPGPEGLGEWNQAFLLALKSAERGPGWPELAARSRALGSTVQGRAGLLAAQRDEIRAELDTQERGGRALKGYGATLR